MTRVNPGQPVGETWSLSRSACGCPRHESNMRTRFRKPLFYLRERRLSRLVMPFCEGGMCFY